MAKEKKEDGGDEVKPPPFGTQVPIQTAGNLPRVIVGERREGKVQPAGNYRAPAGTQRFKVHCPAVADLGFAYILAKPSDVKSAKECFLKHTGLDKESTPPELVVVALPD